MKSFYISGYKNESHINKMLLDSFVLYVPYLIYNRSFASRRVQQRPAAT